MVNELGGRRLGDLEVSAVGFGAMVLSPGLYGPVDDQSAVAALRHAVDRGVTLIDTSDSYGSDFHNERLVGQVLGGRRSDVVVATKFGFRPPPGADRHSFAVGYAYGKLAVNAEPRHFRGYAQASARRLRRECIDLLYPHFPDPVVPIEETVGAMAELVAEGLVGHIGLSNVTADQLARAVLVHPVSAVQVEWSLWHRIDPALLAVAEANRVGVVAWGPLGSGFLTGSVASLVEGDFRHNLPRFEAANLRLNIDRFAPVRDLAHRWGITSGQLAIAWLLAQCDSVVPIPGSRNPDHIDENLAAAGIRLGVDQLSEVEAALAEFRPEGATLFDTGATTGDRGSL